MAGADGELRARAVDRIGVAIAPRARHGQIAGRSELVEWNAPAAQGYETALGFADLQQVHADSGEADGLSRSRAFVSRGHLLEIVVENGVDHGGGNKDGGKGLHRTIFGLGEPPGQARDFVGLR